MFHLTSTAWLKIVIIAITLYFFSQVTSIYLPVIFSTILAFILNPLVIRICALRLWPTKCRISRSFAILISFVLSAILLAWMIAFILLPFVEEFNRFIINLPVLTEKLKRLTAFITSQAFSSQVPESVRGLVDQALSSTAAFSVDIVKRLVNGVISFATQIVELVVVPVLTYYLLKDWQRLKAGVIGLVPCGYQTKVSEIITEMAAVISGYIRGQVLVSVIVGMIVFSGMYFLHIEYPLVLGLLAALTEMIPIIGPVIGAAPAVLLAYLISPVLATKVAVFYIIVQQVENHIIVPKVMGHSIDLHPIAVIISLLIGGQFFGIVGMMVAVPAAALIKVLARHLWYYGER